MSSTKLLCDGVRKRFVRTLWCVKYFILVPTNPFTFQHLVPTQSYTSSLSPTNSLVPTQTPSLIPSTLSSTETFTSSATTSASLSSTPTPTVSSTQSYKLESSSVASISPTSSRPAHSTNGIVTITSSHSSFFSKSSVNSRTSSSSYYTTSSLSTSTSSITNSPVPSPIFLSPTPSPDCFGVIGGGAHFDSCGICNGRNRNIDNCGICFGRNSTCPNIDAIQFAQPNSGCISVFFSTATNRAQMREIQDCNRLFGSSTLNKLGKGATCSWADSCSLMVCYGAGSTILPGDFLNFNPVICSQVCEDYLIGSFVIPPPIAIPTPIAILKYDSQNASCSDVLLDGSYSQSTIGRTLIFSWECLDCSQSWINQQLAIDGPIVVLPRGGFVGGTTLTIRMTVTNFLGGFDSTQIRLNFPSLVLPQVSIGGPPVQYLPAYRTLVLHGRGSSNCSGTNQIDYEWKVFVNDTSTQVDLPSRTSKSPILELPEFFLQPEVFYRFQLTANDGNSFNSANVIVNTLVGPICAVIDGGE